MRNLPQKNIYLDHNATTPLRAEVLEVMLPYLTQHFGNPDSRSHVYGWQASAAIDVAREQLLKLLEAPLGSKLVFTSSATEANNLALKGVFEAKAQKPLHIITQVTEHMCVLEVCRWFTKQGHHVTCLPVDQEGFVNPDDLKKALLPQTSLVSVMLANNEIGTIQDIKKLAQITHEHSQAFFHTDAVQAMGKIKVDVKELDVDLLTLSAHKMYGPKGVGALFMGPRMKKSDLMPQIHGGGHEDGKRSGTLNVPGIVGLAKACELAIADLEIEIHRQSLLQNQLIEGLLKIEGVHLNGSRKNRLYNNVNVWIEHLLAETLMLSVPELAFSSGSACASGKAEPSYVIQALGRNEHEAKCSVRFGLGRDTLQADIDYTLQVLNQKINDLK